MTNVEKVMLKYGKIKQEDVDAKIQKQTEKVALVEAVKADKTDKSKLTKAQLLEEVVELEGIIESLLS